MKPEDLQKIHELIEYTYSDLNDRSYSSDYWQGIEDFRNTLLEKLSEANHE